MAFYQLSWLILFAPLFSFAVIIFGTRVWDMLSRPRVAAAEAHSGDAHAEAHEVEAKGSHGDEHGEHGLDDDEDPKVAHLSMGALVSGYVGIVIMRYRLPVLVAAAVEYSGRHCDCAAIATGRYPGVFL